MSDLEYIKRDAVKAALVRTISDSCNNMVDLVEQIKNLDRKFSGRLVDDRVASFRKHQQLVNEAFNELFFPSPQYPPQPAPSTTPLVDIILDENPVTKQRP